MKIDDLEGKSVLVTGASTGIGAAVARAFAEQGAQVAIHCNASTGAAQALADALRAQGRRAFVLQADLARRGAAAGVVNEAAALLGGLDILVNNAGSLIARRPFLEADDALVDAVFDLNLRAVISGCQAAVPHMARRDGGAIINVGSIAAVDGGGPGAGFYAAAKASIHSLTRHLARDLAGRNIRVNAVAPGVIATPFHAATPPERMDAMRKAVPMGRVGEPGDCVGAFLFFASAQLSGYVTGQTLHVNGGQLMV